MGQFGNLELIFKWKFYGKLELIRGTPVIKRPAVKS